MTPTNRSRTHVTFPSDLDIVTTREFDAPIQLVYDVFTQVEHVRQTFAPYGEEVTVCEIDLRVGGTYHYVMVTPDGIEMSFRGTFLELDPPRRTVQTWSYDGWPGVETVETMELDESNSITTMTHRMRFADITGRAHMKRTDGLVASFDNIANYLVSIQQS